MRSRKQERTTASAPRKAKKDGQPVCYLCGRALEGAVNRDHVPPQQFFPKSLRKRLNPQLLTLRVHKACQDEYRADEDYFVHSIGPAAHGTVAGTALMDSRILEAVRRPLHGESVSRRIIEEFRSDWNGVDLPPGRIAKYFDPPRVYRVVWKIIRGLRFHEDGHVLPERQYVGYRVYTPERPPDEYVLPLLKTRPRTRRNQGVFTYWRLETPGRGGKTWHTWALLFWDGVMILAVFHDPGCGCEKCAGQGKDMTNPQA